MLLHLAVISVRTKRAANISVCLGMCRLSLLRLPSSFFKILEEYDINLAAEAEEERKRTRLLIARLSASDRNA